MQHQKTADVINKL